MLRVYFISISNLILPLYTGTLLITNDCGVTTLFFVIEISLFITKNRRSYDLKAFQQNFPLVASNFRFLLNLTHFHNLRHNVCLKYCEMKWQ